MIRDANPREAFTGLSCHYERHRPDYPSETVDWVIHRLGLAAGDRVADVGAGTGILTRRLKAAGLQPVALDISHEMLGRIDAESCPLRLQGLADALPLRPASVHGILAAQAFHWFEPAATLADWHRALKPGGGVALLWNNRDPEHSAFVRDCEALIVEHNPNHRLGYRDLPVEEILARGGFFTGIETREDDHLSETTPEGMLGFFRSVSYVAKALSPEAMAVFESQMTAIMARHFPSGRVTVPLRCRATVARRADDPR